MVGWRNPARYLAPLAIAAVAAAAYVIVHHALMHKTASASIPIVQTSTTSAVVGHTGSSKATFYIVHPNDTLSKIAAQTHVPVATLEKLNPGVNPSALRVSQRLRLRQ